jgi:hypothetical protein
MELTLQQSVNVLNYHEHRERKDWIVVTPEICGANNQRILLLAFEAIAIAEKYIAQVKIDECTLDDINLHKVLHDMTEG